jgi:hypothetical protein
VRARNSGQERVSVLDMLIARRQHKRSGRPFSEWVAEHRAELEAGIQFYEAQGGTEGRDFAASLREVLGKAKT